MNATAGDVRIIDSPETGCRGIWRVSIEGALCKLDGTFMDTFKSEKNILADSMRKAVAEVIRVLSNDNLTFTVDGKSVPAILSSYRLVSAEWVAGVDQEAKSENFRL